MINEYLNGLTYFQSSLDHVIYIKKEELKEVKGLHIKCNSDSEVRKINLGFEISPESKYDFTNIRFLSII